MIGRGETFPATGGRRGERGRATMTLVALLALVLFPAGGFAQVEVQRRGEENPVLTVSKSTIYGGLAGLVLGGALALAVNENEGDIVKWFFVAGTFGGFGAGVYHVTHRPAPSSALFSISSGRVDVAMPAPWFSASGPKERTVRVPLLDIGY